MAKSPVCAMNLLTLVRLVINRQNGQEALAMLVSRMSLAGGRFAEIAVLA